MGDRVIVEGDTVTGTTPSGNVVTGKVTGVFDTDPTGRPLSGGRRLVVMVDWRERPMAEADVIEHVPATSACVKCGKPTDNYCQVCKRDMCDDCLAGHSHGMDK